MEASGAAPEREVWEIGLWQLLGAIALLGVVIFAALRLLGSSSSSPAVGATAASPADVARQYVVAQLNFSWRAPTAGYAAAARWATPEAAAEQAAFNRTSFGSAALRYDVKNQTISTFEATNVTVRSLTATRAVVLVAGESGGSVETRPDDPASIETPRPSNTSETVDLTNVDGQWKVSNVSSGTSRYSGPA